MEGESETYKLAAVCIIVDHLGTFDNEIIFSWEDNYEKINHFSCQAFNTCYSDTGLWGVYFASERMSIEDMMYNVQTEW